MRIRHLVSVTKVEVSSTSWSSSDLPPRHAPIYAKSRPIRAGWRWRSAQVSGAGRSFVMLAMCNPKRDNWSASLIVHTPEGPSVVARFEDHGSHKGRHVHAHCERGGIETGAESYDRLVRVPPAGARHRTAQAWTEVSFWAAARRFFRVEDDIGPLFRDER